MRNLPAVLFATTAALPGAAAETYLIDSRHTFPTFEVDHYGFSLQSGRFNRTSGLVVLDWNTRTGRIEIEIDAHSIDMGLEEWDQEMRSEQFFDVQRYPTITFQSDNLTFEDGKPVRAKGMLTLLGITRPVELEIEHFSCGKSGFTGRTVCGANAGAEITRSSFGMVHLLPGVGDEVRIRIAVEAVLEQ